MSLGQHVAVINGVLQGETATIVSNPESGCWEDHGLVWIRFDNDGAVKGYAVLSQQWFEIDRLRLI